MTSYRRNHQKLGFSHSGSVRGACSQSVFHLHLWPQVTTGWQKRRTWQSMFNTAALREKGKKNPPRLLGERLCVLGGKTYNFSC